MRILFVTAILALSKSETIDDFIENVLEECAEENDIDNDDLTFTFNGSMPIKDTVLSVYDENYGLRCFGRCYNIKTGIMNPNRSEFDYDLYKILYGIEKDNFEEIVDECTEDNQQEDECDRNQAIDKCILVQTEPGIYALSKMDILGGVY